jgi:hypothetical protein
MIPKKPVPGLTWDGNRFSGKIMRQRTRMIPKSGHRFSNKIMRQGKGQ